MSKIRVKGKLLKGNFSEHAGTKVRRVFTEDGTFLGTITKIEDGYRVTRVDGKVREKPRLDQSFRSLARAN